MTPEETGCLTQSVIVYLSGMMYLCPSDQSVRSLLPQFPTRSVHVFFAPGASRS